MAATISVQISAVDRITNVVDKVNARLAKFTAPLNRAQRSLTRFGQVSGLSRVGKAFGDISHSAGDAFGKVSQIIAPLGAISGAASVAGMARLVSAWADWGSKLGFSAQRIGISADRLQGLQGAAQLAGSSAGGLTSGLQTLGQTMYDAIGGRAPEAAVMFRTLGVAFSDGAGHARSVTAVLPELADKIAALKDPYAQAQAATALFGGAAEDLLPFLRRGSAGIREYEEASRKYSHTSAAGVAAANQFRTAQASLSLSVEGLANRVSERLGPVISPLLTQLADWIAASPAVQRGIDGLAQAAQDLGAWIKSINWGHVTAGVGRFADGAQHVADMLGGWQPAIEKFILFMGVRWVLGVLAPFASLASAILGVSGKLALLAGDGIGAVISRFALMGTAAGKAGAAAEAAIAGTATTGSAAAGGSSLMRVAGGGLGTVTRALPWAGALYAAETYLPHVLSYATGQGWNDETPRYQGASPNQRGGYGGGVRRDPSAPSGRNAGPAPVQASDDDIMRFRPIMDMLGRSEGTDRGRGYDETLAYGRYTGGPISLTGMTLDQVGQLQQGMLANPSNTQNSSAVGRYQFVSGTLRKLTGELGYDPAKTRFTPDVQDRLAAQDLIDRGGKDFLNGAMQPKDFARQLSREWASVADPDTGRSFYGQATSASTDTTQLALGRALNFALPTAASGPPAQLAGGGSSPQGGGPDGSSLHVTVDVNHANAPSGSTVRARVTGQGVDVAGGANVAQSNVMGTLP